MIGAAILLASIAPAGCTGIYALVPARLRDAIPFSLSVKAKRIHMVQMDYGGFEVPYTREADGALRFRSNESDHALYRLSCAGATATVTIAHPHGWTEKFKLVRTHTDIWGVAKARGWPIGD